MPTFHMYAELWWNRNQGRFAPTTREDYQWRLERHLLPFFAEMQLDAITFDTVERYIAAKLAEEKPLSSRSINMTVTLLATILEGGGRAGADHPQPSEGQRAQASRTDTSPELPRRCRAD